MATWQEWLKADAEALASFHMWVKTTRRNVQREQDDAVAKGELAGAQVALGKKLLLDQISSSTTMADREEAQHARLNAIDGGRLRATRS